MTHPHAHILQAIIDGKTAQYSANGDYWSDIHHCKAAEHELLHGIDGDFYFRIKPATVTINGVELEDDRITGSLTEDDEYFVECAPILNFYSHKNWDNDKYDNHALRIGVAHRTKEGAIAFCKARLGIKD